MSKATQETITALQDLQNSRKLKIIELNAALHPQDSPRKRQSDVSTSAIDAPTPASLETDLTHYKELFSKLRFSYVEQVTKEKFLRAIVDNPPLFVEHATNVTLEKELAEQKAALKQQKIEVAQLIDQLEEKSRSISERYETVQLKTTQLSELPDEIANLESAIQQLQQDQVPHSANPALSLPLPETQKLLAQREEELAALNAQVAVLEAAVPRKARELERLERELQPLETQKQGTVAAAKEARRRREAGEAGMGDEIEENGRWYRAVEKGLNEMVETST